MAKNIDYLIPSVRMLIGDTNPDSYRYLDQWLVKSLVLAIKSIRRYLGAKYLVSDSGYVSRDDSSTKFSTPETVSIIEMQDEYLIALKSAIITLQGDLEQSSWNLSSWRDAEVSVSNQEVSKTKDANLKRLMDEFIELAGSPSKRLARAVKGSLPGYLGNEWEHKTDL